MDAVNTVYGNERIVVDRYIAIGITKHQMHTDSANIACAVTPNDI